MSVKIISLEVEAAPGQHLYDAMMEACEIAFRERRTVTLIHNGRRLSFNPEHLLNMVYPKPGGEK